MSKWLNPSRVLEVVEKVTVCDKVRRYPLTETLQVLSGRRSDVEKCLQGRMHSEVPPLESVEDCVEDGTHGSPVLTKFFIYRARGPQCRPVCPAMELVARGQPRQSPCIVCRQVQSIADSVDAGLVFVTDYLPSTFRVCVYKGEYVAHGALNLAEKVPNEMGDRLQFVIL